MAVLLLLGAVVATVAGQERLLFAAPAARGTGDGSTPDQAMELQAAFDATRYPAGPISVRLLDGHYQREYLVPSRGNDNAAPPLTIAAMNPGRAIIDGADPVTGLEGPDAHGVWSFAWTERWGLSRWRQPDIQHYEKPIFHRRELLFVNGQRLTLVMTSDARAPVAPSALQPGQFTVDDVAGCMRFKPVAPLRPATDVVEVSRRGVRMGEGSGPVADAVPLLRANGIAHLTLDGLVVRRSAGHNFAAACEVSAIGLTRDTFHLRLRNLTITRCHFVDNGGKGLNGRHWIGVTVRHSEFSRNGNGGGALQRSDDVLYEDCTFADNNWRFGSWMNTWDASGTKILDGSSADATFTGRSQNRTYRRCGFLRNHAGGLWSDWGPRNLVVENCLIADNSTGVQVEINIGPVLLRDTVIRGHGGGALYGVNAPDVTLERCVIVDALHGQTSEALPGPWNGSGLIAVAGDPRNENRPQLPTMAREEGRTPSSHPPAEHYRTQRWVIRDSLLQATTPRGRLFWARYWGEAAAIGFNPGTIFADSLRSERNRFFQLAAEDPFLAGGLPTTPGPIGYLPADALARIDPTSTWAPVSDAAIAALDPRDGRRLDPAALPLASDEERRDLLQRVLAQAAPRWRIPATGGSLRLPVRNPLRQLLTCAAVVEGTSGWQVAGGIVDLAPGQVGTLTLELTPPASASTTTTTNNNNSLDLILTAVAPGVASLRIPTSIPVVAVERLPRMPELVLDGVLQEWSGVPRQAIDRPDQVVVGRDLLDATADRTDPCAGLQVGTDGIHLFLAIAVEDDQRWVTDGPPWEQDALELFWDHRPLADRQGDHGPGTGQLVVTWPEADGPIPAADWRQPRGQVDLAQVRSYARRTPGGWTLEMAVPVAALGGQGQLVQGGTIALNLNVSDRDGKEANVALLKRLSWSGAGDGSTSTADYRVFRVE